MITDLNSHQSPTQVYNKECCQFWKLKRC